MNLSVWREKTTKRGKYRQGGGHVVTCNRRKLMRGHLRTPTISRRNHDVLLAGAKTRTPVRGAAHAQTIVAILVGRRGLHAWPRVH